MSRFLLDTSAYSGFKRGNAPVREAVRDADALFVNAIILGELRAGFRGGGDQQRNDRELNLFLRSPRVRILDVDAETSDRYAVILSSLRRAGTPVATNDIWIAASAMQHGLPVLTGDADFEKIVQIVVRRVPTH